MELNEGDIVTEILQLGSLIGTCQETSTLNSMGRSSKNIVIEYDVKQKEQDGLTN